MGTFSPKSASSASKVGDRTQKQISKSLIRPATPRTVRPSVAVPRQQPSWLAIVGAIALILLAAGGMAGSGWLALQLIVNPQGVPWFHRLVPGWLPQPLMEQTPKTLRELRQELQQSGQRLGEPLVLGQNISSLDGKTTTTDVLMPVLEQPATCLTTCDRIVELRLYQTANSAPKALTATTTYYLVDRMTIAGLEESFVIAPLVNATASNQGSSRVLPLTQLSRFETPGPNRGIWLNLSGNRAQGDEAIAYGQILYYQPQHQHLSVKLQWTSPTGELPVWKDVTSGGSPELVVHQTLGMDPAFEVYQLKPLNFAPSPVQLEQISLTDPAINHTVYRSALLLARNRLWSTSLRWLQSFKQQHARQWNSTAQAQLDLVRWHALATRSQAEGSWASPSQQVLANLVDGRWERALTVFQASVAASQETALLLQGDQGRLEQRIKAALRVSPTQLAAKSWGALLLAAQKSPSAAIAWLKQQPQTKASDITTITALIKRLDPAFTETATTAQPLGRIIGEAQAIAALQPAEWRKPVGSPPLQLAQGQRWYRIQVSRFHTGKRWQRVASDSGLTANASAAMLWEQLGLSLDSTMQLWAWTADGQNQTITGTIKAGRVQGNRVELLIAADAIAPGTPSSLFAVTENAFQWVGPSSMTLSEWVRQQPTWSQRALPTLIQALQATGALPSTQVSWQTLEPLGLGNWTVQAIALTNGSQPDVILTLYPDDLADLRPTTPAPDTRRPFTSPRTLIFAGNGKLIYNELAQDAGLTYRAIADLGQGLPAVVVGSTKGYQLLQWSAQAQQLE